MNKPKQTQSRKPLFKKVSLEELHIVIDGQTDWLLELFIKDYRDWKKVLENLRETIQILESGINQVQEKVWYPLNRIYSEPESFQRIHNEILESRKSKPVLSMAYQVAGKQSSQNYTYIRGDSLLLFEKKANYLFNVRYGLIKFQISNYKLQDWQNEKYERLFNKYLAKGVSNNYYHRFLVNSLIKYSTEQETSLIEEIQAKKYWEKVNREAFWLKDNFENLVKRTKRSTIEMFLEERRHIEHIESFRRPFENFDKYNQPSFGLEQFPELELFRLQEEMKKVKLDLSLHRGFTKRGFLRGVGMKPNVPYFEAESFLAYKDWLTEQIDTFSKPRKKKKLQKDYICWIYPTKDINEKENQIAFLFNRIISLSPKYDKGNFTLEYFKLHFENGIWDKFPWYLTQTLLCYLFERMENLGMIAEGQGYSNILIANHFLNSNGKDLNPNALSNPRSEFKQNLSGKPKNAYLIDNLLDSFLEKFPK